MKRQHGLPLTLQLVDDPGYEEEEWIVKNVERIRLDTLSFVFRATIYRPDNLPLDAVLKLDPTGERQEAFLKEAQAYQTIGQKLQGSILPVFYGCFHAQVGATMVTCVAIEFCGEPLEKPLHEIENPLLSELLLYVGAMHHHGMSHGDIYPRNILVYDEHPVLIDLETAESHTCGLRMKAVPGAMRPTVEEYGCAELHSLVCRMGIWKPGPCSTSMLMAETHSNAQKPSNFSLPTSSRPQFDLPTTLNSSFLRIIPRKSDSLWKRGRTGYTKNFAQNVF
ncbi:hypothetical protein B0H11DRAFT_1712691 [Mycena galericulata]|nr:hypothetical protein B0H11DRAFT_1712691 [Mycena galericulata]